MLQNCIKLDVWHSELTLTLKSIVIINTVYFTKQCYSDYFYFNLYVVFKSPGKLTKECLIHNVSNKTNNLLTIHHSYLGEMHSALPLEMPKNT